MRVARWTGPRPHGPHSAPRGAIIANDPALRYDMAMPDGLGYERLIAAGISMAQHADGRRDRFVAAGFGENFVDQLKQAALDLQRAVDLKSAQLGHRAAATSGMTPTPTTTTTTKPEMHAG